jgi:hypothetical protein
VKDTPIAIKNKNFTYSSNNIEDLIKDIFNGHGKPFQTIIALLVKCVGRVADVSYVKDEVT